jgi:hypothetical protein
MYYLQNQNVSHKVVKHIAPICLTPPVITSAVTSNTASVASDATNEDPTIKPGSLQDINASAMVGSTLVTSANTL